METVLSDMLDRLTTMEGLVNTGLLHADDDERVERLGVLADYLGELGSPFAYLLRTPDAEARHGAHVRNVRVPLASRPATVDCNGRHLVVTAQDTRLATVYRDDGVIATYPPYRAHEESIFVHTAVFDRHLVLSDRHWSVSCDLYSGSLITSRGLGLLGRRGDLVVASDAAPSSIGPRLRTTLLDPASLRRVYACPDAEPGPTAAFNRGDLPAGVGSIGRRGTSQQYCVRDTRGEVLLTLNVPGLQPLAVACDGAGASVAYHTGDHNAVYVRGPSGTCRVSLEREFAISGAREIQSARLAPGRLLCRGLYPDRRAGHVFCYALDGTQERCLFELGDVAAGDEFEFLRGGRFLLQRSDRLLRVRDVDRPALVSDVHTYDSAHAVSVREASAVGPLALLVSGQHTDLYFLDI